MTAFSPAALATAGMPGEGARLDAAERAASMTMPTPEQEVWRYSRIGDLHLDRFRPVAATTTVSGANGYLVERHDLDTSRVHDVFDELNTAFHTATVVSIPRGAVAGETIVVTHHAPEAGTASFPRLVVDAGENSEVTVIERFVGGGDGASLMVPRVFVRAQQAARLHYVGINELSASTWLLGHQQAEGHRDSSTQLGTVALGGDYARVRTDASGVGQGASTTQIAVYFASGTQMHDFRTLQDHVAPKTHSDLLFKGALGGTARSVYTGLIRIRAQAKGSAAFQTNRNLTLSEGAWAESVPNLEIETNDVKCSHASTVGPIDEDQRFYLESRGLPPEVAERLVVLGFFDEVLDRLPVGALSGELRLAVAAKLNGVN